MHQTPDRLAFGINDLPSVLSLGATSVRALIKSGALPSREIGGRVVVLRSDLEAFLSDLPVKATAK